MTGPADRRTAFALVAAAATGVQVGAAIVATRYVAADIGPAPLAFLRYAIGALVLVPAVLATPRVRIAPHDIAPIALLGVAQFGLLIWLLNLGLRTVPAARGALIFAVFPMLTMVIAAAAGHERLGAVKATGVALTIAGVGLALGDGILAGGDWTGEAAVLASAFVGALCSVLYRPYVRRYPTLPVSFLAMLAAVAALAVPALASGLLATAPSLGVRAWLAIAFIGLSSGVGYVLWLYALEHASATRVTVFLALGPPTAALLGALLLSEPVPATLLAGLGCVAVGLVLANR